MGKLLIWFGILYGNLVALVGLAVISVLWTKEPSGQEFCEALGLTITGCRTGLLVVDFFVMGTATFLSFRRLALTRQGLGNSKKGDTPP